MKRTAVVTGGAGFIGSHLCQALLAKGWRVRAVDDLSTGRRENLAECEGHSSFELILADIRRPETWRTAIDSGSVVFHQAAITSVRRSIDDPLECHSVNATGTLTVLETARRRRARRAVLATVFIMLSANLSALLLFTELDHTNGFVFAQDAEVRRLDVRHTLETERSSRRQRIGTSGAAACRDPWRRGEIAAWQASPSAARKTSSTSIGESWRGTLRT